MMEVLQLTVVMKDMYCVDQKTELVYLMDHGQDHHQSVSVSYELHDSVYSNALMVLVTVLIQELQ